MDEEREVRCDRCRQLVDAERSANDAGRWYDNGFGNAVWVVIRTSKHLCPSCIADVVLGRHEITVNLPGEAETDG